MGCRAAVCHFLFFPSSRDESLELELDGSLELSSSVSLGLK